VNGVLRALARSVDGLPWPDPATDPVRWLALATGHPDWMVGELHHRLGTERTRAVLEADDDAPGLTLRATGDRDALVAELRALGIDARPSELVAEAVRAPGADPRRLAAVTSGRAVPQDEASMLVVHATGVRPGDRVIDLCAGPGGKATHLAALAGPDGHVVAVELRPARAAMIADLAARVGVGVDVRVGDGTDPPVDGAADVVLVDAPCTGLGTGRRRPEVRWRRSPDDLSGLGDLQRRLLAAGSRRVRAGGRLTFAVCTWTQTETNDVVDGFLHSDEGRTFEQLERVQLWPDGGTDGMFWSVLRRTV